MSVHLYPHNQETYDRMTEMFKAGNRVGIVQPTGTGKSFLFLKWIEDHKAGRTVVLAPSNEIFNQLIGYAFETGDFALLENVEMITYQTLMRMSPEDIAQIHADRIIIDEFHRTGAPLWGAAVLKLLEVNANAKVLGATATPIRYLDGHKDMASILFGDNLACYRTLGEVIARGILPMPTYIPVWYDYDEKLKQYQEDIAAIEDPKERAELEEKLHELKNNLQNAYGVEDVFKKHMPSDHGKYIVFCRDFEHLQEMQKTMNDWLSAVNPNVRSYVSISRETDRDEQLNAFKADDGEDAIKLLFTIDRLNEGVHIKGVDGVIMLRPTTSPIIYLQQMGRALAAGSKSPVIFDMVNNYRNVQIIAEDGGALNPLEDEFNEWNTRNGGARGEREASTEEFKIFAQMAEFTELFDRLENNLYLDKEELWQMRYELFKEYVSTEDRIPTLTIIYKNVNIGSWLATQKKLHKKGKLSAVRESLLRSIGVDFEASLQDKFEAQWQENYALLKEYVSLEGRLPPHKAIYKGANLGRWLDAQKKLHKKGKLSAVRESLLRSIGVDFEISRQEVSDARWQQNFELLKEYVSLKNRFPPTAAVYKGVRIWVWLKDQKRFFKVGQLSPEREALLRSVGVDFETTQQDKNEAQWQQNYELLREYVSFNDQLAPTTSSFTYKGVRLGAWLNMQKQLSKSGKLSPERKALLRSIGVGFDVSQENINEIQWQQNFSLFKEYVSTEDHIPTLTTIYKNVNIGSWLSYQKQAHKAGQLSLQREALLRSIGVDFETSRQDVFDVQWRQNYELLKEYVSLENRLPPQSAVYKGVRLGSWLGMQKNRLYKSGKLSSERQSLLRSLGVDFEMSRWDINEVKWQRNYALLKEYVSLEGRLPPQSAIYKGGQLGVWFYTQKQLFKKGKLPPERESLLRSAGVEFKSREKEEGNSLEDKIAAAEEYRDEAKKQVPGEGKEKSPRNELGI